MFCGYFFCFKRLKEYSTEKEMREPNLLENINSYFKRNLISYKKLERIALAMLLINEIKWFSMVSFE